MSTIWWCGCLLLLFLAITCLSWVCCRLQQHIKNSTQSLAITRLQGCCVVAFQIFSIDLHQFSVLTGYNFCWVCERRCDCFGNGAAAEASIFCRMFVGVGEKFTACWYAQFSTCSERVSVANCVRAVYETQGETNDVWCGFWILISSSPSFSFLSQVFTPLLLFTYSLLLAPACLLFLLSPYMSLLSAVHHCPHLPDFLHLLVSSICLSPSLS